MVHPAGRRQPNRFITEMKSLKRVSPSRAINLGSDGCGIVDRVCDTQRQCVCSAIFFISEVSLLWKKDISGKLLAIGFAATMRLFSNYFGLLLNQNVVRSLPTKQT